MKSDKIFWITGILSGLITYSAITFHLTKRFTFLDQLLVKSGPPGKIAAVLLWFVLWMLLALLARFWRVRSERKLVAATQFFLDELNEDTLPEDLDEHLQYAFLDRYKSPAVGEYMAQLYEKSQLRSRLRLLQDRLIDHNRSDRISFLLMGQSGVDAARAESSYGPLRALVWAMPGLGFMGTAFEMAKAVGGLGTSLGSTSDYLGLRNLLVTEVIPHLAGAFDITLFALGGSVACFLLLSLVYRLEEEVLNDADAVSLSLLSKIADERPQLLLNDGNSRYLAEGLRDLRLILQVLSTELNKLNGYLPSQPPRYTR